MLIGIVTAWIKTLCYVCLYDVYYVQEDARSSGILSYIFILFVPRVSIQFAQYNMQDYN